MGSSSGGATAKARPQIHGRHTHLDWAAAAADLAAVSFDLADQWLLVR